MPKGNFRKKTSNQLRDELAAIPNTPENFKLRFTYWKLIMSAIKEENRSRKLTAQKTQAKKDKKKASKPDSGGGTLNPGLAKYLENKQGETNGD
jgi:hypothetical protein